MVKALIAVDLQNDFYEEGALGIEAASEINEKVNQLLEAEEYKIVVASQDWHPAAHLSFASNHNQDPYTPYDNEKGLGPVLWPDHCVQGSKGAEFKEEINTDNFDYIIRKGREIEVDSYSAFYDNDGSDLGLKALLKSLNIDELDIVGLAFDYCVKYTALDAVENDFQTNIIIDAVKAVAPENNKETKKELKKAGVNLK